MPAKKVLTPEDKANNAIAKVFKARVRASKDDIRKRAPEWKGNIERRIGGSGRIRGTGEVGNYLEHTVSNPEINPDWSLTKTKTANLFSQTPAVTGTHENQQYMQAVSPFVKQLNYEIGEKRARVGVAMNEGLNDVVNASGFGAIKVEYAARFTQKLVPTTQPTTPEEQIPDDQLQALFDAKDPRVEQVEQPTDVRFPITRISPTKVLRPENFTGSDFDDADFLGEVGEMSWTLAKAELNLTDADKDDVVKAAKPANASNEEDLRIDPETGVSDLTEVVSYWEIFYWRYRVDPDEPCFERIWRLVYVDGKRSPVVHEPWECQEYDEQTHTLVGPVRFPIRIGTVTYISDNPVPPSDTRAGAAQVDDLRRSRRQMFMNRDASRPMRWADVNRVPLEVQEQIARGTWQGVLMLNGDGNRAIGEVARASYPSEDLTFDVRTMTDLMQSWQIGPDQAGVVVPGRRTKAETENAQGNFATRIGQERNFIANWFLGICDVVAGLMVRYSDFSLLNDQEKQALGQWDMGHVLHNLVLKIRPDSTIVLDTMQRLDRIFKFINFTVKSGYVNPKPLIIEAAELSGIDPATVIIDPPPPKPEDPNISLRLSGKQDLMNPLAVALILKSYQISPTDIEAARKVLLSMIEESTDLPGAPGGPPLSLPPDGGGEPPAPGTAPDAHPNWNLSSKVAQRSRDMNG